MRSLKNKKILVGITGGIAAYKIPNLVRELIKLEAEVKVILTSEATKFVTPYTLEILIKNDVFIDQFELLDKGKIVHTSLSDWPDLYVIVPATANSIAKITYGICDNLLTLFTLSSKCKILVVPSMHTNMFENEITQKNINLLKERGFYVLEPEVGELAGGDVGKGRLPEIDRIIFEIIKIIYKKSFINKKILVTAGPTREYIDPVRFISNPSSGKMGYELALEGVLRGGDVTLISGKVSLKEPYGVKLIDVETSDQMYEKVSKNFSFTDYLIMSSAVCDFKPKVKKDKKIKKEEEFPSNLEIEKTKDILKEMGKLKRNQKLIGFALETENEIENAKKKLIEKNLDMIILNKISNESGFEKDTNEITIINKNGKISSFPVMPKSEVSKIIFDFMEEL
ncbi:MAG: bifunctional phosphopantothenoylcysteine decarboxylase/phosphopantothenate--cysteine ligase CoaBC [Caldisericia bacterium]